MKPRPDVLDGKTMSVSVGCGHMYCTVNMHEGKAFEVFVVLGKGGGCQQAQSEAIGRLVSLGLRSGADIKDVISQLKSIRCPKQQVIKGGFVRSCADGAAIAMERILFGNPTQTELLPSPPEVKVEVASHNTVSTGTPFMGTPCPECGEPMAREEGCQKCYSCGHADCG